MIGSNLCRIHQFKQGTETPKSPQASLPSVLPGVTEAELHSRMKEQDKRIEENEFKQLVEMRPARFYGDVGSWLIRSQKKRQKQPTFFLREVV